MIGTEAHTCRLPAKKMKLLLQLKMLHQPRNKFASSPRLAHMADVHLLNS